jgi:Protein of unknown function (DUF2917)
MAHLSTGHYRHDPAPWEGDLPRGGVVRLEASERLRWVQVTKGRVWLTSTQACIGHHPDRWVVEGASLALPAGSEWVAEAGAATRYLVLEAPERRAAPRAFVLAWRVLAGLRALTAAWTARRPQRCIEAGDSIASAGTVQ